MSDDPLTAACARLARAVGVDPMGTDPGSLTDWLHAAAERVEAWQRAADAAVEALPEGTGSDAELVLAAALVQARFWAAKFNRERLLYREALVRHAGTLT